MYSTATILCLGGYDSFLYSLGVIRMGGTNRSVSDQELIWGAPAEGITHLPLMCSSLVLSAAVVLGLKQTYSLFSLPVQSQKSPRVSSPKGSRIGSCRAALTWPLSFSPSLHPMSSPHFSASKMTNGLQPVSV